MYIFFVIVVMSITAMRLDGMYNWHATRESQMLEYRLAKMEALEKECSDLLDSFAKEEKKEQFFNAVEKGDKQLVEKCLKDGVDSNASSYSGLTPLALSLKKKHHAITKILIDNGAEVNIYDRPDCSPLHIAIDNEDIEGVKLLLNHPKIDLNVGKQGKSVLVQALVKKRDPFTRARYAILTLLFNHEKFNPWYIDKNNMSALYMLASGMGQEYCYGHVGLHIAYKQRLLNAVTLISTTLKRLLKPYHDRRHIAELLFVGRRDRNSRLYGLSSDVIFSILSYLPYSKKDGVRKLRTLLETPFEGKETPLKALTVWSELKSSFKTNTRDHYYDFIQQAKDLLDPLRAAQTYEQCTRRKPARRLQILQKSKTINTNNRSSDTSQKSKSIPSYMRPTQSQLMRDQQNNKHTIQEKHE